MIVVGIFLFSYDSAAMRISFYSHFILTRYCYFHLKSGSKNVGVDFFHVVEVLFLTIWSENIILILICSRCSVQNKLYFLSVQFCISVKKAAEKVLLECHYIVKTILMVIKQLSFSIKLAMAI